MADLAKIVDELSALTVLEAAELKKMLEDKWGVTAAAAAPMMMAAMPGAAATAAAAEFRFEVAPLREQIGQRFRQVGRALDHGCEAVQRSSQGLRA